MSIILVKKARTSDFSNILRSSSLSRLETEILMAFVSKKPREFLLTHPEMRITTAADKKFRALERKRLKNWPIAYLTGHKEFYGLDFTVSPATLVPRPETEMIVTEIIDLVKTFEATKKSNAGKLVIIDLGAGSGAIIIAAANELKEQAPAVYRDADFIALDISVNALKIAKKNAVQYGLEKKIRFFNGDLLEPLITKNNLAGRDLIIAANLPYLTPMQIRNSPSISREPKLALNGGRDGLKYYRALFGQLRNIKFKSATVLCEIDPKQTKKMTALAAKYFPGTKCRFLSDLSGQKRLFITKIRP